MSLYGIDISKYQQGIDLSVVPCDFVIVYVTGGPGVTNPAWREQVEAALANGKRVLLYHYGHDGPAWAAVEVEAGRFLDATRPYWSRIDGLVLDWEERQWIGDIDWALAFLDKVRAESGKPVWLYAYYDSLTSVDYGPIHRAGYPLWEAAYVLGYQQINGYSVPGGRLPIPLWGDPQMWQFTQTGRLSGWGGDLDLNVFYGDWSDWDRIHQKRTPDEQFFLNLNIPLP
jgi:GH25 family lysozyme M1 (1,4-beta-N-acetylmuramidase)